MQLTKTKTAQHYFSLVNRNGGFVPVSADEYRNWRSGGSKSQDLIDRLHSQTLNRGFDYADFDPRHRIVISVV
jgi:hypothetical protein